MNKGFFFPFLILIISSIFLMNIISSQETNYAGGCYNLTFPNNEPINFQAISGELEGFSWTQNDSIITYCLSPDFKPQTFRVRWFNDGYQDIVKEVRVGGGGTRVIQNKTNVTNIIEVPKFIDREVTKEVPIPSEPKIINKIPVWIWVSLGILFFSGIIFLRLYTNERRYNKNGNTNTENQQI